MALVPVDICNIALVSHLGQDQIISLSDGTKAADLCSTMYPIVRDEMIRSHPWRRLKKRATLAADATAPVWGFNYRYAVPTDMLKLLDVWKDDVIYTDRWEMEGDYILMDDTGPIQIRYMKDSNDPDEWDSLMVQCFAARLGVALAEPLTQSQEKIGRAVSIFQELEARAQHESSQEGQPTAYGQPDGWDLIRYGGASDDVLSRGIS